MGITTPSVNQYNVWMPDRGKEYKRNEPTFDGLSVEKSTSSKNPSKQLQIKYKYRFRAQLALDNANYSRYDTESINQMYNKVITDGK